MLKELRPALVLLVLLTLVTGVAYPLLITGIAGLAFPDQAAGSLILRDGKVLGSELIGQNFTAARYFHGRPSAIVTTDAKGNSVPDPYDGANSAASNLGPTSKALIDRVADETARLHAENPNLPVPVDLVTTSASGLDPDITPAAAFFQVPRVAKARGLAEDRVRTLVQNAIDDPLLGLVGESHVNVLKLNLALDALKP